MTDIAFEAVPEGARLPWQFAYPLILLALSIIDLVLVMIFLTVDYETFCHFENSYTRFKYVKNQALGAAGFLTFYARYAWLVDAAIW